MKVGICKVIKIVKLKGLITWARVAGIQPSVKWFWRMETIQYLSLDKSFRAILQYSGLITTQNI